MQAWDRHKYHDDPTCVSSDEDIDNDADMIVARSLWHSTHRKGLSFVSAGPLWSPAYSTASVFNSPRFSQTKRILHMDHRELLSTSPPRPWTAACDGEEFTRSHWLYTPSPRARLELTVDEETPAASPRPWLEAGYVRHQNPASSAEEFESRYTQLCNRAYGTLKQLERDHTTVSELSFERQLDRIRALKLRIPLPKLCPRPDDAPQDLVKESDPEPELAMASIFAPREQWADSKALLDTQESLRAAIAVSWGRASSACTKLLLRVGGGADVAAALGKVLWRHHTLLFSLFDYYASIGSSDDVRAI